jgi:hypothetical protein
MPNLVSIIFNLRICTNQETLSRDPPLYSPAAKPNPSLPISPRSRRALIDFFIPLDFGQSKQVLGMFCLLEA